MEFSYFIQATQNEEKNANYHFVGWWIIHLHVLWISLTFLVYFYVLYHHLKKRIPVKKKYCRFLCSISHSLKYLMSIPYLWICFQFPIQYEIKFKKKLYCGGKAEKWLKNWKTWKQTLVLYKLSSITAFLYYWIALLKKIIYSIPVCTVKGHCSATLHNSRIAWKLRFCAQLTNWSP